MHKIVIIDDTQINLTLMSHLVQKLGGCEPLCFSESAKALEWCRLNDPDLIIVDYMMPAPDGLEFTQLFRTLPGKADIPLLMVTANDHLEVRYRALELGANDFLTKPIDKTELLGRVKNMLSLRNSQKKLADHAEWLASEVRTATEEILAREREIVFRLSRAAEYRDPETGAHILRMAHYSKHIAQNMGLSQSDQDLILEAAPMHDIGKVGIADGILLKPGRLSPEEFVIMKRHTQIGHDILTGSASYTLQTGAMIALTHHEKFDGTGYPNSLSGEGIPLFGRIVAVADVFDALTSERPYKPAWELERAVALIRDGSGSHFDPDCVEAFFMCWENILEIRTRFQDDE
ncbi:MAG: two-component system response regulator [Nitrosomonadales bacterium]|nr:MAG: two-component system response regulator [Nitrosomonadales bacterium]